MVIFVIWMISDIREDAGMVKEVNMKLNKRLKMIADQIPYCGILTDVGTDHAYIPIYAAKNEICRKALALDLREGPLRIAEKNIKKHGLIDRIETRIGNGLEPVRLDECDVIVIAGMGGFLIKEILSASMEKAKKANLLMLQPNNAVEALRQWLYENGFDIEHEHLTMDSGKLYVAIQSRWTGQPVKKDEFTYYIGEKIFEGNEEYIQKYLKKKLGELEVIIEGRNKSNPCKKRTDKIDSGMSTENCILIRNRLLQLNIDVEGRGEYDKVR